VDGEQLYPGGPRGRPHRLSGLEGEMRRRSYTYPYTLAPRSAHVGLRENEIKGNEEDEGIAKRVGGAGVKGRFAEEKKVYHGRGQSKGHANRRP